jgi:hypothetical protein
MSSTMKTVLILGSVAVAAGAAFWVYKKHPEWIGLVPQNPSQVNPAVQPNALASKINAASNALDTVSNVANNWLG